MKYIFLSPHFDDVVYSCGGFIFDTVQKGHQVEIWTICGGLPPKGDLSPFAESLHTRWETPTLVVETRRQEDIDSCQVLGAHPTHFNIPDCIYRKGKEKFLYSSEESLFDVIQPEDDEIILEMIAVIEEKIGEDEVVLFGPIGIGGHVDHQLTRSIIDRVNTLKKVYYAEFPYTQELSLKEIDQLAQPLESQSILVTTTGKEKWGDGIAKHTSQMSTFWNSKDELRNDIDGIIAKMEGQRFYSLVNVNLI